MEIKDKNIVNACKKAESKGNVTEEVEENSNEKKYETLTHVNTEQDENNEQDTIDMIGTSEKISSI